MASGIITLTSDFGTRDHYVGEMKAAILSVNPLANLVDITHEVQPQDVESAAWLIGQFVRRFPAGTVHLAVVDPEVGSSRPILVCQADEQLLVLPDNGLLTYVTESAKRLRISSIDLRHFPNASPTFHGRDVMGRVAAKISLGSAASEFGPPAKNWVRLPIPKSNVESEHITGQVVYVDRFGNAITNIHRELLGDLGRWQVLIGGRTLGSICQTYSSRNAGDIVALIGSHEFLEIAQVNGNAAETLGLNRRNARPVILARTNLPTSQ